MGPWVVCRMREAVGWGSRLYREDMARKACVVVLCCVYASRWIEAGLRSGWSTR